MLASEAGAGILGGIIAGFLAGYVVKGLNVIIRLPASLTSLKTDFNFTALRFDDCWFDDDLPHQSTSG
ncbi:fused fructose-specific PTS enzymes: IIBcomponent/IIC components [Haemophilus influenzae]|uniref:Fused fructose-specific PTS enzymes: IIBcomponent/IIC components n=1 Tax=Haemophilus influenzae TaxID=727 RepID=A0A2X1QN11_HAEIF|nr:fused fructose-specific PTS enzymes: IIBcomponent/IIC components [Haemophilus influenzae]